MGENLIGAGRTANQLTQNTVGTMGRMFGVTKSENSVSGYEALRQENIAEQRAQLAAKFDGKGGDTVSL